MKARGPPPLHEGGGAPAPLGRAPYLVPPYCLFDSNSNSIYCVLGRKNQREEFIAFYDTEPPPSPKTSQEG